MLLHCTSQRTVQGCRGEGDTLAPLSPALFSPEGIVTSWVLIIYLSSAGLYLPLTSHPTEESCLKALEEWEFQPGYHGTCLPGVIEPERKRGKRK